MLTTFRLEDKFKDLLKLCTKLSPAHKNTSDVVRHFIEKGSASFIDQFEKKARRNTPPNIAHIAQKYERQQQLTPDDLEYLFWILSAQLRIHHYSPHPVILEDVTKMFLTILEGNYLREEALEHFNYFILTELTPSKKAVRNLSEAVTETAKVMRAKLQEWKNYSICKKRLYSLEAIGKIMEIITDTRNNYLIHFDDFQQGIYPFLKTVIKIVKYYLSNKEETNVLHCYQEYIFLKEHHIKNSYHFIDENYNCYILCNAAGDLSFSARLSFKKIGVAFDLSFHEFNDLLFYSTVLINNLDDHEKDFYFLRRDLLVTLFTPYNPEYPSRGELGLNHRTRTVYLSKDEFKELFSFMNRIEQHLHSQLQALQYQLGVI